MNRTPPEEVVFIAGSGRSGTSWLANVLNADQHYRYHFEPFHPKQVPEFAHFSWRQFVPVESTDPSYLTPIQRMILHGIDSPWANQFNHAPNSQSVLIKAIRANLLLPWLQRQLPWVKLILIVRHPIPVVLSQIELEWASNPTGILRQPGLREQFPGLTDAQLSVANDFDKHLLMWAVENSYPLSHLDVERFHLVFYERLVEQPDIEFGRLEYFLGHPLPETAREAWNRSSASSRLDSAVSTGADRIRSWLGSVNQPYLRMADEILSWFGLDKFYASGQPTPLKSNAGV